MKHKNIVWLEGRIGDNFKYMKTRDGREFATFIMVIKSFDKDYRDSSENKSEILVRIMVFDHKLVAYLKKVNAHNGCLVSIMGRLNSHVENIHEKYYHMTDVVVRDIHIVKTIE